MPEISISSKSSTKDQNNVNKPSVIPNPNLSGVKRTSVELSEMSAYVTGFGCRLNADRSTRTEGPASESRQRTKSREVWHPAGQRVLWGLYVGGDRDGGRGVSTRRRASVRAGEPRRVQSALAGTWSLSTGDWWIDGGHGFERRAASQNASTTFAIWHECCTRGDLIFLACVISNSCAWQK
jgi:hypothetical protein